MISIAIVTGSCIKQSSKTTKSFNQVVFVSDRGGEKQLHTMSADGKNQRLLSRFKGQMVYPSFSPNGRHLLFFTFGQKNDIWLINDIGKIKNYTNTPRIIKKFANFSPDSKKIAYSALSGPVNLEIVVGDIADNNFRQLTKREAPDSNPLFSPDGKTIYWTSQKIEMGLSEISRMDAGGKNQKQLTFNDEEDGVDSISPDGKWLVSSAVRDGQWEIMIYSNDAKKQIRLTNDKEYDTRAFWQPNGNKIFWQKKKNEKFDIFITEFPKLIKTNLTKGKGNNFDGQWTTDGRIIFASDRDGDYEIYIMNNDGSNLKQLTHNNYEDRMPAWRP